MRNFFDQFAAAVARAGDRPAVEVPRRPYRVRHLALAFEVGARQDFAE